MTSFPRAEFTRSSYSLNFQLKVFHLTITSILMKLRSQKGNTLAKTFAGRKVKKEKQTTG